MDLLLQLQADQLGVPVQRPRSLESTALGAATLAGLAEGVWGSVDELADLWVAEAEVPTGRATRARRRPVSSVAAGGVTGPGVGARRGATERLSAGG